MSGSLYGRGPFGRGLYSRTTVANAGLVLQSQSRFAAQAVFPPSDAGLVLRSVSSLIAGGHVMWGAIPMPPCAPWDDIDVPPCAPWETIAAPPCAPWTLTAACGCPTIPPGVWPQ